MAVLRQVTWLNLDHVALRNIGPGHLVLGRCCNYLEWRCWVRAIQETGMGLRPKCDCGTHLWGLHVGAAVGRRR